MKKAIITGITGQDGSYLAEFLLNKGYEVHGIIRRASSFNTHRIDHIYKDPHNKGVKLFLHHGDLADSGALTNLIHSINPDEVYHLGAQSHVAVSFEVPEFTGDVTGLGTTRLLEAIRQSDCKARFYQASSSEMFGSTPPPQNEETLFHPRSPYAAAKVYAYWMTVNYREGYNMHASNGILFNHESPRRGETFVTRKITRALANILKGTQDKLYLGNLNAKRDWGYAPEYVECQWLILQQDNPDDYVIGTGVSVSVRDFVEKAFEYAGVELEWSGTGVDEKGIVKSLGKNADKNLKTGDVVIEVDEKYFRPTEVDYLLSDITKAKTQLKWTPKILVDDLAKIMVDGDMELFGLEPIGESSGILKEKGIDWTNNKITIG